MLISIKILVTSNWKKSSANCIPQVFRRMSVVLLLFLLFFLTMPSLRLKVYYRETGTFNSVLLTMLLSGTKSGSPSTKAVHSSLELALQDIRSQEPVIRRYSFKILPAQYRSIACILSSLPRVGHYICPRASCASLSCFGFCHLCTCMDLQDALAS